MTTPTTLILMAVIPTTGIIMAYIILLIWLFWTPRKTDQPSPEDNDSLSWGNRTPLPPIDHNSEVIELNTGRIIPNPPPEPGFDLVTLHAWGKQLSTDSSGHSLSDSSYKQNPLD